MFRTITIRILLALSVLLSVLFAYYFFIALDSVMKPKAGGITETMESPPSETANLESLTLVGIGDSLTRGIGDETSEGYFQKVRNHLADTLQQEVTATNLAVSGATTDDLLKVLAGKGAVHSLELADIILLTIGANDLSPGMMNISGDVLAEFEADPQTFVDAVEEILDKLGEINPDAQIYWVGLYNPFGHIEQLKEVSKFIINWNHALEQVAIAYPNAKVIPAYDLFLDNEKDYLSIDQYHPNQIGYQAMADRVSEAILVDLERLAGTDNE